MAIEWQGRGPKWNSNLNLFKYPVHPKFKKGVSNVTTRTKNLTLIIKFDAKGIVEDFNVRSGGY